MPFNGESQFLVKRYASFVDRSCGQSAISLGVDASSLSIVAIIKVLYLLKMDHASSAHRQENAPVGLLKLLLNTLS